MARAVVDPELCQGHTLCNMAAPDIFQLREEDGHAYVVVDELTARAGGAGPQGRARLPRARHHRGGVAPETNVGGGQRGSPMRAKHSSTFAPMNRVRSSASSSSRAGRYSSIGSAFPSWWG